MECLSGAPHFLPANDRLPENTLAYFSEASMTKKIASFDRYSNQYISGLYYKLITIVIDAARSDAPNWSVNLTIVIGDASYG